MKTTDLDVSTRPSKWAKRGPQPAVESAPPPPVLALNHLAARIREETDPSKKRELERQYAASAKAIEKFTTDSTSEKLGEAICEIVTTFSPIIDPHPDSEEGIRMPETMTRDQWQEVHGRLLQCKRAAAGWLAKSRRFATERWGAEFVGKCETQMELELGIEHQELEEHPAPDYLAIAASIAKRASRLPLDEIDRWDESTRKQALAELSPMVAIIDRLRG
jgi:hypothetical protein